MAITNQLLLIRERGSNDIKAYNRSLDSTPVWTESLTYLVAAWVVDYERDKLWISGEIGTADYIVRYAISDTGLTLETAIAVTAGQGCWSNSGMTIDESTGSLYVTDGYNSETIRKVLLAGTTIEASTIFASTDLTSVPTGSLFGALTYYNWPIQFANNQLMLIPPFNSTDTTPAYPMFQGIDSNLSTYSNSKWMEIPQGTPTTDFYPANQYENAVSTERYFNTNTIVYNRITNNVAYISDRTTAGGSALHIYTADLNTNNRDAKIHYANPTYSVDRAVTYVLRGTSLFCGKYSGSYYSITRQSINKFNASVNHLKELGVGDHGGIQAAFNEVTEDIYIGNINTNTISCYDKHLNTVNSITLTGIPAKMLVVPGTNDVPSNEIIPSTLIYPVLDSSITDTTPTLAFKVGDNPSGWTQQFRVVADTTYDTIANGGPATVYDRAFDSWLNGINYADCTWMYSTDYTAGNDPDIDGTWAALGTGDGAKSGGVHITDGLDSNQTGTFHVKMTIPAGSELTGGATNTPWYFNIFSYSAT